ncbi:hypothetical protein HYD48_02000 [Mycoplasmopsis bovis]|nr:hypothetical protein [Mycoplasmopsis bovis]QQH54861.1 hypothetical protein HYD67_02005 [Mycoplasmopsis bovis]QQH77739.1 hypothetical protein HYD48_02000 [Mycoplasmopsis bovis]
MLRILSSILPTAILVTIATNIPAIGAIIYFIQNGICAKHNHIINENIIPKGIKKLKLLIFKSFVNTNTILITIDKVKIKTGLSIIHKVFVILTLPNSGATSIHTTDIGIIIKSVTNKTVSSGLYEISLLALVDFFDLFIIIS